LKWNLFWQNNIDSLIIEVNGCLIISPCMIANKTLSLIAWKLFWIEICVTGFDLNIHLCFFYVFYFVFSRFWFVLKNNIWVFVFISSLIYFGFWIKFWFVFRSNQWSLIWFMVKPRVPSQTMVSRSCILN
jgi:hypothetical protein